MECLRRSLRRRGLSSRATRLISRSCTEGTAKQYQAGWSKWMGWCRRRDKDPVAASVERIANFLADEFVDNSLSYNTINSYRSAISSVHDPVDGVPVGQHPTICRLLKGVALEKPPVPRYATTWDVGIVIRYLRNLPQTDLLSLKQLTFKFVMLAALVSADRGQTLASLNPRLIFHTEGKATCYVTTRLKTSQPGKPVKRVILPAFPLDRKLCVKTLCRAYVTRTAPLRRWATQQQAKKLALQRSQSSDKADSVSGSTSKKATKKDPLTHLFISYTKPHLPVTSGTIAKWIKTVLHDCGIKGYGAHSTRSASSSAASDAGLNIEDIMKAADWSKKSTFTKFYDRSGDDTLFGRTILTSRSGRL